MNQKKFAYGKSTSGTMHVSTTKQCVRKARITHDAHNKRNNADNRVREWGIRIGNKQLDGGIQDNARLQENDRKSPRGKEGDRG